MVVGKGIGILWVVLATLSAAQGPRPAPVRRILFWNLENCFDWRDDPCNAHPSEAAFSSFGDRHWTRSRFRAKCRAVAKTLFWAADDGGLPDVFAVAEIENGFVLEQLLETTLLRKTDYIPVHFDSPDPRGIDVGLLYRKSHLEETAARPLPVRARSPEGASLQTRDILLVCLRDRQTGDSLAVLVNHHPSKYGGEDTAWRREAAVRTLRQAVDSLLAEGWRAVFAVGDFNDTPQQPLYGTIPLENLALPLFRKGEGTIRYEGRWEMIDHGYSSVPGARLRVLHPPFLTVRDGAHAGEKPLRTYSGPRYLGGVSDHRPILLEFQQ